MCNSSVDDTTAHTTAEIRTDSTTAVAADSIADAVAADRTARLGTATQHRADGIRRGRRERKGHPGGEAKWQVCLSV